ncbi:2-keto-4-pentenoate hydratase [Rhizorhabdus dicambivorans]|uniref:2-keto-4-pentenoate hydratase n=1 Tax=Rhizorhabdus dicambivorans TaxID=1850238 RepID=A0A2A4FY24_9SPHN|nr:fumarylacetoacetate hydrolase family protein [Rhizorhabdus dicambivorans]ATE65989.1 2-keto-4-pentenoate hydratase [Rhizorhabdus dicambivorans]PCE43105.1 2-keto-4-pentenoate hydratase [Rhizorhabdus dicambivorans]
MEKDYQSAAQMLRDAYQGSPVAPLRDYLEPTDVDGAYAVQAINTRQWLADGRRLVGRKIGLTSKAVQTQLGVGQPDFGALFADMEIPDGGTLDPARAIQPKAEAEIAFILGRDIDDPDASVETVVAAIDQAMAAIEIVDSRIADWKITFADTVADNGSSAFFVLAKDRLRLDGLDLYSCGMVMEINGAVVSLGAGAACLGHPLNAAQWLARTLAARGEPLRAGDILLSGALGPMVALNPGDEVRTTIGGIGSCSFRYA